MAYIQPDGVVEFFGDIGLSPNYENTLYFASTQAKDTYFSGLLKITTASAITYSRQNRGFIRVEKPMSLMYNVGYMRFKNSSFENKWFYAFVKSVNYINNITTEIEFDLDVLMTWMGDFLLKQCFIERQHTTSDNIGEHLVDEGLPCGDLVNDFIASSGFIGSNGFAICFGSTFDPENNYADFTGGEFGGIYSGVHYSYSMSYVTINNWISGATGAGKSDGIIGLAIVPYTFITEKDDPPVERTQSFTKPFQDVGGYYPVKNNKLFTYPYKSLQVTNLEGNFGEFRYEFFRNSQGVSINPQFKFIGVTGLNTEIVCVPMWYKGLEENIAEKISMSDFPMCSYSVDAFQAYWAMNKSSIAASAVSSVISLGTGLVTKQATLGTQGLNNSIADDLASSLAKTQRQIDIANARSEMAQNTLNTQISNTKMQGLTSTITGIAGAVGSLADYARKPPQAGGSQGNSALFGRTTGLQKKDFWFTGKTITAKYAKIIDDYFTMFGYRLCEVGQPNMNARPHWTYVKTVGCVVEGSLPADDAAFIERIFDNGVRFWKNYAEIGNYSLNNAPT